LTEDKLRLMKAIRGATGAGGIFLLYEPTRRADEGRAAFLDRFMQTNKPFWRPIILTPAEWDQIWQVADGMPQAERAATVSKKSVSTNCYAGRRGPPRQNKTIYEIL
jgi:hypothetical protein